MLVFSFLWVSIWSKSVVKIPSAESYCDELLFKDARLTLLSNKEAESHTDFQYYCSDCATPGKKTAEIKELLSKAIAKQHKNMYSR